MYIVHFPTCILCSHMCSEVLLSVALVYEMPFSGDLCFKILWLLALRSKEIIKIVDWGKKQLKLTSLITLNSSKSYSLLILLYFVKCPKFLLQISGS